MTALWDILAAEATKLGYDVSAQHGGFWADNTSVSGCPLYGPDEEEGGEKTGMLCLTKGGEREVVILEGSQARGLSVMTTADYWDSDEITVLIRRCLHGWGGKLRKVFPDNELRD